MRGTKAALLLAAAVLVGVPATAAAQDAPSDDRFEVSLLDRNITQGIRIETLPDGRVLLAERDGRLKVFKPDTGTTVTAGQIPTGVPGDRLRRPRGRAGLRDHAPPLRALRADRAGLHDQPDQP